MEVIHVRRTWTCGQVGLPKSKASKGPVPLHPLLAEFMLRWKQKSSYSRPGELGVSFSQVGFIECGSQANDRRRDLIGDVPGLTQPF